MLLLDGDTVCTLRCVSCPTRVPKTSGRQYHSLGLLAYYLVTQSHRVVPEWQPLNLELLQLFKSSAEATGSPIVRDLPIPGSLHVHVHVHVPLDNTGVYYT